MVTELNTQTFDAYLQSADKPVLVDLWASWCGPCKMLSPLVDQLAEKMSGKLLVAKVNVDESSDLAIRFGVNAIPALLLFKDGALVDRSVGYIPMDQLVSFVQKAV